MGIREDMAEKFDHHSTPFILDKMDKRKFWKYVGFRHFTNVAVAAAIVTLKAGPFFTSFHSLTGTSMA